MEYLMSVARKGLTFEAYFSKGRDVWGNVNLVKRASRIAEPDEEQKGT